MAKLIELSVGWTKPRATSHSGPSVGAVVAQVDLDPVVARDPLEPAARRRCRGNGHRRRAPISRHVGAAVVPGEGDGVRRLGHVALRGFVGVRKKRSSA